MSGIFKAYDIRGIYPEEIDESLAHKIGIASGNFFETGTIVVGHDMRKVAEPISEALIEGLLNAGQDIIDIGLSSTPMNYNAIGHYGANGGIMVTASHNPAQYIGFKLSREEAKPVSYETGINDIESSIKSGNLSSPSGDGHYEEHNFLNSYVETILDFADDINSLRIALDTGNGMGGLTVPPVLDQLPVNYKGLFLELDGSFPNHIPNPLETENLSDLQDEVVSGDYDLGMAFDGDADRVAFIDEQGKIIKPDILTALLVEPNLKSNPEAAVVYDLRSSRVVPEEIQKYGGEPIQHRVGHAYMKSKMREVDSVFGGELSGHYYYRKNYYTDCGLIAALDVLNLISQSDKSLSEEIEPLNRYSQSGEINFEVDNKESIMNLLAEQFSDGQVHWLDGVTVEYENWWFNVRPSNTEPLLRLNLEAQNNEDMQYYLDKVRSVIHNNSD